MTTNTFTLRTAERKQAKLRIGLSGPSGSGKTYSALLLARGIASDWGKICLIDTENGSGELYSHLGQYNTITLEAPYSPERYIAAIQAAENAGMEVIVVDSTSHEWEGKGGVLEINELVAQNKFKGNTWSAWSETTPRHQKFIAAITTSPCHIITTVRNKVETMMTDDKKVKKVGTKEIQREGFEYELTINFTIDRDTHMAMASKDRTGLFISRDPFVIDEKTGQEIMAWNGAGKVDTDGLKKAIFNQVKNRLEVQLPEASDQPAFFKAAIPKLTGLEMSPENLPGILDALKAITDKEWAQKTAWGEPAGKEDETTIVPEPEEEVIPDIL